MTENKYIKTQYHKIPLDAVFIEFKGDSYTVNINRAADSTSQELAKVSENFELICGDTELTIIEPELIEHCLAIVGVLSPSETFRFSAKAVEIKQSTVSKMLVYPTSTEQ